MRLLAGMAQNDPAKPRPTKLNPELTAPIPRPCRRGLRRSFPGGVYVPAVRAFRAVGCAPPFIHHGLGCLSPRSADGTRLQFDYFGSWGPMILGHAFPPVVEVDRTRGAQLGQLWCTAEARVAERICGRHPAIEKMRHRGPPCRPFAWRVLQLAARSSSNSRPPSRRRDCFAQAGSGVVNHPGSVGVPEQIYRPRSGWRCLYTLLWEARVRGAPRRHCHHFDGPFAGQCGCISATEGFLAACAAYRASRASRIVDSGNDWLPRCARRRM